MYTVPCGLVGHELGANATAAARKLGMLEEPFDLILAGGVFHSQSALLIDAILEPQQAVASQVRPAPLRTAPVARSVLLAMDTHGQK